MADYQQILASLDADPTDATALAALERMAAVGTTGFEGAQAALDEARRMHRERGDLELVARLFDVELATVRDQGRKAFLLAEKGKLLFDEILDENEAVECFRRALELRPDDADSQEMLAQIDLVRGNWERIVKKYLDEARVSTDRQLTTSLYLSVAETYARYRPQAPEVEQYLRKALEVEPRNRKASTHLERLLRRAGRWEELATLLEQRVDAAASKEERVQALLGLADVYKGPLGRPTQALDAMKKVIAVDPAHPRALNALLDTYGTEENWSAQVKVYESALKGRKDKDPAAEQALVFQIAMLYWKRLNQMDQAEEYFRRIRKNEPAHPAMVEFYRAYHTARGEANKLLQVLQAAHKAETDAARQQALSVEIASLAEASSGNPEKAIDSWKAILRKDPKNNEARQALKRLYQRTEKWNALLELLKEEVESTPADQKSSRVERLLEVVAIYRDRLNLDVMVINTFNNILALQPDHPVALDALAAKYEQLGRWNDLITVLSRKAEAPSTPQATRAALLRRIASIWTDRFGNHAQAVKPLEELLAIEPGDRESLAKLKDIYTKRRQWRALLDLSMRELDALPESARRGHIAEMARLASDKLGDLRASIAIWNRALEADAKDAEALAALASLYEKDKRWVALAEVYHRQRAAVGADDVRAATAILERLGTLYAEKLDAPAQAAEAFKEVLEIQPGHQKALRILRELYAQAGDVGALEEMYGKMGAWDDLLEVLHGVADRQTDQARKLEILRRIPVLAAERAKTPEKAAKAHEKILALDPQNIEAARALVPIYRKTEKWPRLLATYEVLLSHTRDKGEQLALHQEIRKLCEEKLGSKALAFQWCARAYELAPGDEVMLKDLKRLGAEADAWDQVAHLLEKRVSSSESTDAEKLKLLRELGRIRAVRLHKPDDARAAWERVLQLSPDDPEAMQALEELATQQARWPDLLAIFRRRSELEPDPNRRLEMLFKIAFIEEERALDLDAAARTYELILKSDPRSQRAIRALVKVQATRGDYAGLARALEADLDLATEPESRVNLLLRLGGLYDDKLKQRDKALERYKAALSLASTNRSVHAALEKFLAADAPERVDVARLLIPVYERTEDMQKLAMALEILRLGEKDDAARLAIDRRLVAIYARRLKNPLDGYESAVRVLHAAPMDRANRAELANLAGELAAYDDLAAELEKVVATEAAAGSHELWTELAELYDEKLDKPAQAERAWRRVLELDGTDQRAYDALERILRGGERWQDLRAILEQRVGATLNDADRKEILLQICDLYEGVLEDQAAATDAYRRVLELDPSSMRAYKALERLHEQAGRWRDLEDLLGRELAYVKDDADTLSITFRRADIRARWLKDPTGAVELAEEVLTLDPGHQGARLLLESLFPMAELKLRIARILGPRYEAERMWPERIKMLRGEREFAVHPADSVEILARIATLEEERLGDEQAAFTTWREAILTDPEDARARGALERLARRLDRWEDAAKSWEQAIDKVPTGDLTLRATLLSEVAAIYDRCLGDARRATHAYRRLLEADAGDLAAARPAAEALERLYDEQESWSDLIEILRRQAEWADAPERRSAALVRIAGIQENKLGDLDAAITTWREVLAEDPEHVQALDALERLHGGRREPRELAEVLRRRVEQTKDASVKRALLARIAGIMEKDLHEPGEAIVAWLEILDFLPDDVATLSELARLYRGAERWADLLEINERRLALAGSTLERAALRMELGDLLLTKVSRHEEALERFREVLAEDSSHTGALQAVERFLRDEQLKLRATEILQPIYAGAGEFQRLVDLYELEAAALDDPRDRLVRLRKIAELRERNLGDKAGAFDAYARAAREALAEPELKDLLAAIERLATQEGRLADLVALYRELAPDVLDAELQRRLYLDVADLARGKLGDLAMARDYYRRVLDAYPDDQRALGALELLYRETHEHEALREVLTRKSEMAADDVEARRDSLVEIAVLAEEKLGRREEAIAAWEQVLELQPNDADATKSLERLYAQAERWAELAELLERRLGFAEDLAEAVDLRFRLGELFEKQLTDPDRAVENYEAAIGGDPNHQGAIAALERYLEDAAARLSVSEVLEPIYIARQDWGNLIRITEIRLDAEADPTNRLALTRRIARLYEEQLEDLEGAFRWYGKVFRENPEDKAIRDQLLRLASILDRWDGLANIFQEYLDDETGDPPAVVEVARSLADIYDRRLGDVERARAAYRRVLGSVPQDQEAFGRLEAMLTRAARWFALIESYEEGIEAALEPGRRKDLLFRIARVQEVRLTAVDKAIDAYRAILDIDADDEGATLQLDRLYQEQKRWRDLAELLTTRIERSKSPDEAASLRVRLAEVLEGKLDETGSAIDQYEIVVNDNPSHQQAIQALERIVVNAEHRQRIAQILEPIYRRHDWWQKLVVILDAQLEYVDDKHLRMEMLLEIARIHRERGGAMSLALKALSRAWKEEPANEEVYAQLESVAEALGAWGDLIETLESAVEDQYDYDLAARLLARVGTIQEVHLGDPLRAIVAWRRVLEVKEDDLGALDALERLHAGERQNDALVKVLERKVELLPDPDERKGLLGRAAEIYETSLGNREQAVASWRQVLAIDDRDAGALDALERLYREARDHRNLVEILQTKIDQAELPAARRGLRFAAAEVFDRDLKDTFEAIAQYRAVLDENPDDGEALAALDAIHAREKSWTDLVEVLDRRATLERDPARRADLAFRAAKIVETEEREVPLAVERYRAILAYAPLHEATRAALAGLLADEDALEAAADALEPVYRSDQFWDQVADLYERRLRARDVDPIRRRELAEALAKVQEEGRRDTGAAFAVWARYLREDPEDAAVQSELERLANLRGTWSELTTLYEAILGDTMNGDLGRHYALKLAQTYEDALGDHAAAASRYRKALDFGGDEAGPLAALDRIHERQGQWRELAEVLAREAQAAMSDDDQATFLFRLGDVRERSLGDAAGAVAAYREVLERQPRHGAARAALERLIQHPAEQGAVVAILEPLYENEGDHARLADVLEVKVGIESSSSERAQLLSRIAEIAEKRLSDPMRALGAVGRWLAEDPSSEEAAAELERLAGDLGRWEEAAARLSDVVRNASDPDIQRELSLRLGRIHLDALKDPAAAEEPYRRALELDRSNATALAALDRVYRALGDAPKLVDILARRAEGEYDAGKKRALWAEVGHLRETELGDDKGAVDAWKEVLDLNEADADAHQRLAAIYDRTKQWEALVEILEVAARHQPDRRAEAQVKRRIAAVLSEKLGDHDRAVDAWNAVTDLEPNDESAIVSLADVHRRRGDFMAVQETLVRRLNLAKSNAQRVAIYRDLARLAEVDRAAPDDAIQYLFQILDVDNSDAEAYAGLERLLSAGERWHDLVEVFQRHADVRGTLGDSDGEIALLARAADIWEGPLGNSDAAAEILEKILQREPGYVPALTRLARIYEAAGEWDRCGQTLQRALALQPTGRDAADLYFRLGKVTEAQGGDPLPHFQQALAFDTSHPEAIQALEAAARERGDWRQVADFVARRRGGVEDPKKQLELTLELADLYRTKLGRAHEAVPYLEQAAQLSPDDPQVVETLAELYFAAGRATDAEPLYRKLAERAKAAKKAKDMARFQQRLGALCEQSGNAGEALKAYEEAFRVDPTHGATMAGLGRLYFAASDWEKARRVYRSMLLQNLDASVGVTKADVYLQLGLIHARLGEGAKAKSMYERGLELEPNHAGLREAMTQVPK